MSTTATARTTLEALRVALDRKDYDALEGCYADGAVSVTYSERNRPSSAAELRGPQAIGTAYREAPQELTHEINDEVVGEERIAFRLTCTYPTGELVVANSICDVRDGLITRQVGVEAWDE